MGHRTVFVEETVGTLLFSCIQALQLPAGCMVLPEFPFILQLWLSESYIQIHTASRVQAGERLRAWTSSSCPSCNRLLIHLLFGFIKKGFHHSSLIIVPRLGTGPSRQLWAGLGIISVPFLLIKQEGGNWPGSRQCILFL